MSRTTAGAETANPDAVAAASDRAVARSPLSDVDSVLQGGRRKAYRPLPVAQRREAVDAALAAWARGDWFETHELLEPAWMGTAEPAERDLYQGLIKLAAAFVHQVRGNRAGVVKNLVGARERMAASAAKSPPDGLVEGLAPAALLTELVALEREAATGSAKPVAAARDLRVTSGPLEHPVALAVPGLIPPVLRRTTT